jgi:hypothetical protein
VPSLGATEIPNAHARNDFVAINVIGLAHRAENTAGEEPRFLGGAQANLDDREFIATETCDGIDVSNGG